MGTRGWRSRKARQTGDRGAQLRTGHDGDAEHLDLAPQREGFDGGERIGIDIAIDDLVLFAAFEHGGEVEHGERHAPVLGAGAAGMKENDHDANLPQIIQNREGGRAPFQRAFQGRMAHCQPYQGL